MFCFQIYLFIFRFAGHDSTSHTLSFAIYHICKDKEILERVLAEVNALTLNTLSLLWRIPILVIFLFQKMYVEEWRGKGDEMR